MPVLASAGRCVQRFDRRCRTAACIGAALPDTAAVLALDDRRLAEWCTAHLGSEPTLPLFRVARLSTVVGVRLADGREVVLKARPPAARVAGCVEVQRHLFAAGFPCPEPLCGPEPLDGLVLTAESYVPGGDQLAGALRPNRFADVLARLVEMAPPAASADLWPAPPWAWPDVISLWPEPDGMSVDLNAHPGPAWLDDLAEDARDRVLACGLPTVVGHSDFESQNIRWVGRALLAVHDWDSVAALPEPVVAGLASAVFTATGAEATEATVDESAEFLAAYQVARGGGWPREAIGLAWWAGLWVRAFNAKKAFVRGDGSAAERLLVEREARLSHAA